MVVQDTWCHYNRMSAEAQALLRGLRGLDLIGGDVVEVSPPFDPSGNTALVGATIMYEILCILAETVARRKKARGEEERRELIRDA